MKAYDVELSKEYAFLQNGKLSCILMDCPRDNDVEEWKRPAVVVVPGGGYGHLSKREGEPVAAAFLSKGFQTFILWYSVAPDARYPEQLFQLSAAVDYVRKNAQALNVNPEEIFVVGFSAGGHLTGNLCVEYESVSQKTGVALNCKPTAVGLCYPVISRINGHQRSYINLLEGYTEEAKEELLKTLNLDQAVSDSTPPAFICSTVQDTVVPTNNAIRYALALDQRKIPYELHIYPLGGHGLSTGSLEINQESPALVKVKSWVNDCAEFFRMFVQEKF